ncbi:MAG: motility associated factor glycosyltransferase family protein [Candidatus Melainabacteria bacterium]
MSFLENNLSALAAVPGHEALVQALQKTQAVTGCPIEVTADGGLTIEYQGVFLHEQAGAVREARALCDQFLEKSPRALNVLLGLGFGYVLQEMFHRSEGPIVVVEPHLPLLRFVLENIDLTPFLGSGRVFLAHHDAAAGRLVETHYETGAPVGILVTAGYAALMGESLKPLADLLGGYIAGKQAALSVGRQLTLDWIRHFLKNLPDLVGTLPSDLLKDCASDRPALILGAGPSLAENIEAVRRIYQGKSMVLIAVGRSLRFLQEHGIQPDLAVFVDFEGPAQQLTDLPLGTANLSLALGPFSERCCMTVPAQTRYLVPLAQYANLEDWLDNALDVSRQRLPTGGTVSFLAVQLALLMGCPSIVMVGQDLALPGGCHYAGEPEAEIDEQGCLIARHIPSLPDHALEVVTVRGQDGGNIQTLRDYQLFIQYFEAFARENQFSENPRRLINASVGGAQIEGFEVLSLASVAAMFAGCQESIQLPVSGEHVWFETSPAQKRTAIYRQLQQLRTVITEAADKARAMLALSSKPGAITVNTVMQLQEGLNGFMTMMQENPFVGVALARAAGDFNRQFNAGAASPEQQQQNATVVATLFRSILSTLDDQLAVWVDDAMMAVSEKPAAEVAAR